MPLAGYPRRGGGGSIEEDSEKSGTRWAAAVINVRRRGAEPLSWTIERVFECEYVSQLSRPR